MTKVFVIGVVGFAALAMVTAACSSDDSSSSSSSSSSSGGTTAGTKITASAGGTVTSGDATLTIPPGALEKDTTITVAVLPAAGGSVTSVYDFGPDGTTFKTPATIAIKAAASLSQGSSLVVAIGSGTSFTPIEGSTYANGVATAPVAHFTGFTVLSSGTTTTDSGTDSPVTGGDCAFKGTFSLTKYACGTQDVTSTWKSVVPTETMVVTDKAGGGCSLTITHMSSSCTETESFDATVTSGSTYSFAHKGISACNPAACKFADNDAPCATGDRVFTESVTITADGAGFKVVQPPKDGELCGTEATETTWTP